MYVFMYTKSQISFVADAPLMYNTPLRPQICEVSDFAFRRRKSPTCIHN